MAQVAARLNGLVRQEGIEHTAAHDPEGGRPGQLRRHRILQAPGEAHPADHLIHRGRQIEGEPALHRGRHATATGFGASRGLGLQQDHPAATGRQMERRRATGGARAHDDHIGMGGLAHTLRMSASFSASFFSSSAM